MDFAYYILTPFTWLLQFFYDLMDSYGFALILFAVVVKLILFPFSLKGKKGMIQMNMLQGKMQQIQKKYPNDREKQNQEIQSLYARENVNPMGGCLWSFLPLLVLLPLYAIVRQPLKYMMGLTGEEITTLIGVLNQYSDTAIDAAKNVYFQLTASSALHEHFAQVAADPAVASFAENLKGLDFSFLGLSLTTVPNFRVWAGPFDWNTIGTFLIPVVSALTGLLFSVISMKTNQLNRQSQSAQQASTNRTMMIVSPVISLWVGFSMPAAMSIYWIANNLLSMVQEVVAGRILKKDYEAAAAARAEQERLEKEEEKQRRREAAERKARAIAEAKASRGKKKAKPVEEKKKSDASVIAVSGVGIRAYARGRAYDPYRYSPEGPTPYRSPGAPIDETAVEAALERKSERLQKTALEGAADELIVEELLEAERGAAPAGEGAQEGPAPGEESPSGEGGKDGGEG